MTVTEFTSHLHLQCSVSVRNLDSQNEIHCKVCDLESADYAAWHDLELYDWYVNNFGKVFMEVRNV